MKNYTEAGKMICKLAIDRNMTLKEVAEQTKTSYSHLSNMLKGSRDITTKYNQKLNDVFKLDKEQRYQLKEAIFISNKNIVIPTKSKKDNVLHLIYWLVIKGNLLSADQISRCMEIVKNKPTGGKNE